MFFLAEKEQTDLLLTHYQSHKVGRLPMHLPRKKASIWDDPECCFLIEKKKNLCNKHRGPQTSRKMLLFGKYP